MYIGIGCIMLYTVMLWIEQYAIKRALMDLRDTGMDISMHSNHLRIILEDHKDMLLLMRHPVHLQHTIVPDIWEQVLEAVLQMAGALRVC